MTTGVALIHGDSVYAWQKTEKWPTVEIHMAEQSHPHTHDEVTHSHPHSLDDHQHSHSPGSALQDTHEQHTHEHTHDKLTHTHEHDHDDPAHRHGH